MGIKKYYLTTPLYYVNSKPHIGHSYTNIASDALARFKRLTGNEVLFLTGTDEHGQKIAKAAEAAGLNPQEFTDKISLTFRELWQTLNISYDDYIRTTEPRHKEAVRCVWLALQEKGEIYTTTYSGWYCTPDENFWTEKQVLLNENAKDASSKYLCPDCRRPVEYLEEENFFFKLSKYQDWLKTYIREHKDFILPETRRNEVLGFLDNNVLTDLCISRPKSRLTWGIESPLSKDHVTYVWFDALINYIAACGYGNPKEKEKFTKWWPADVHIIGKDILRHHAVYWTILLKALGLEMPKIIFAHGWWVQGGEKMSKSRGNIVDPVEIVKTYGVDPYRYFLLSEAPFGEDGTFSEEALINRFNTALANDLGNLLHRSLTMCEKYFNGEIPKITLINPEKLYSDENVYLGSKEIISRASKLPSRMSESLNRLAFDQALDEIWQLISISNKYIENSAPWTLAKTGKSEELKLVIVTLMEALKIIAQAVWPFMPTTGEGLFSQLGISKKPDELPFEMLQQGFFKEGGKVQKGAPLFPRIEVEKKK